MSMLRRVANDYEQFGSEVGTGFWNLDSGLGNLDSRLNSVYCSPLWICDGEVGRGRGGGWKWHSILAMPPGRCNNSCISGDTGIAAQKCSYSQLATHVQMGGRLSPNIWTYP